MIYYYILMIYLSIIEHGRWKSPNEGCKLGKASNWTSDFCYCQVWLPEGTHEKMGGESWEKSWWNTMASFPAWFKHHKAGGCQSWLVVVVVLLCPPAWKRNLNYQYSDDGVKHSRHMKTTKQIYRALETPVVCTAKPPIPADIMRSAWERIHLCNWKMWKSMRSCVASHFSPKVWDL